MPLSRTMPLNPVSPRSRMAAAAAARLPRACCRKLLKNSSGLLPKELLVGIETADDAAVTKLNDEQALIATTDFSCPSSMIRRVWSHRRDQCDQRCLR